MEQVSRRDQIEREETSLTDVLAPESQPTPRPLGDPARAWAGTAHGVEITLGESDFACSFIRDQRHRKPERDKLCCGPRILDEVEVLEDRPVTEEQVGGSTLYRVEHVAAALSDDRDDPLDARR